jgi:anti-sigma factor RsiW
VAHLTDGTLRRMVDDPDARAGAEAVHLDGCAECKTRLARISEDARSIATLLAVPDAHVDMSRAFAQVSRAPHSQPALVRLPVLRSPVRPLRLALVAAVAAVALLVVAFVSEGLLFKPSTVTPVPVTVADVQALQQLGDYGTIAWTQQPQFQIATSAGDAAASAGGLTPPVASNVPSTISTTITYGAMTKAVATFTFSAAKAAASAAATGKTLPPMPAGLDGATLAVTVGPAVGEIYGDMKQPSSGSTSEFNLPQLVIAKSAAPTVTSTQVSAQTLEDYILSLPGISPDLAKAVRAVKDPSTTLLIPVPVQYATATQVDINGQDGVALGDNTGVGGGVVWVGKDGYVYVVAGSIKQTDAVNIARTL